MTIAQLTAADFLMKFRQFSHDRALAATEQSHMSRRASARRLGDSKKISWIAIASVPPAPSAAHRYPAEESRRAGKRSVGKPEITALQELPMHGNDMDFFTAQGLRNQLVAGSEMRRAGVADESDAFAGGQPCQDGRRMRAAL